KNHRAFPGESAFGMVFQDGGYKTTSMKKLILTFLGIAVSIALIFIACSKDKSGSTTVKVKMTDKPILTDEVNVDIQQVRVNLREDSTGWTDLNTTAGVYNLLGLQNGVDTLLAIGTIPTNVVQEIRFVLGTNNTIKVNGVVYPLTIPSGAES